MKMMSYTGDEYSFIWNISDWKFPNDRERRRKDISSPGSWWYLFLSESILYCLDELRIGITTVSDSQDEYSSIWRLEEVCVPVRLLTGKECLKPWPISSAERMKCNARGAFCYLILFILINIKEWSSQYNRNCSYIPQRPWSHWG